MRRRNGFTLIEMLVATALTLFLMILLSECFVTSLESFRQLKAAGDMEANLRTAAAILRRDLAADHFDGKRRLSDPQFWTQGPPREGFFRISQETTPVQGGAGNYVCEDPSLLRVPPLPLKPQPLDPGVVSYRAVDHVLHFTVKLRGNQQGDFFSSTISAPSALGSQGNFQSPLLTFGQPNSRFQPTPYQTSSSQAPSSHSYNASWAEVAYFMAPNGLNANGVTLWSLYRRQRLAVPNSDALNWAAVQDPGPLAIYQQVSTWLNTSTARLSFNSPSDLTIPERRFASSVKLQYTPITYDPTKPYSPPTGDDLLLTNVLSFEVKVLFLPGTATTTFIDLYGSQDLPGTPAIDNYYNQPAYANGTSPRAIDTWSSLKDQSPGTQAPGIAFPNGVDYSCWYVQPVTAQLAQSCPPMRWPPGTSLAAISITLRVFDSRTEQTRQVTIIQDM